MSVLCACHLILETLTVKDRVMWVGWMGMKGRSWAWG